MSFNTKNLVESIGNFSVTKELGRNYLYHNKEKIAQCVNGDYESRFGGILSWLKSIKKQDVKRIHKIEEQINDLCDEKSLRLDRVQKIQDLTE